MKLSKTITAKISRFLAGMILLSVHSLFAQGTVIAESVPSPALAPSGATITVDIYIDVSQTSPAQLLGSFSGTLSWNVAVLGYTNHSGIKAGFTGVVGTNNTAAGQINFNGANAMGSGGRSNVLTLTFSAIGANNTLTALDLEFSAMTAALTFTNLAPQLSVTDGTVRIGTTNVAEATNGIPAAFALLQNRPNPFAGGSALAGAETTIGYELPRQSQVVLTIFNLLGQRVKTLLHDSAPAGKYAVRWDGTDEHGRPVPAGIYIYRLSAGEAVQQKSMLVLR